MALHSETEIYAAVAELAKFSITAARQMPRDVKMLLGKSLVDETVWMGVLILRLNKARDAAKLPVVEEIIEHVEISTIYLRLARDLKFIPTRLFAQSLPLTASIAKQAYGIRNHFAPAH